MASGSSSDSETAAVGWVSMSDFFLMTTVLVLSLCLSLSQFVKGDDARPPSPALDTIISPAPDPTVRLDAELAQLRETISAMTKKLEETAAELTAVKDWQDSIQATVQQQGAELAATRDTISMMQKTLDRTDAQLSAAEQRDAALSTALDQQQAELSVLNAGFVTLTEQQDRFRAKLEGIDKLRLGVERQDGRTSILEEQVATLRTETAALRQRVAALELQIPREGTLRKELIGIRGNLENVLFVLDCSQSMRDKRWDNTIKTVETWLTLLPVGNAALITFSSQAEAYPASGQLLEMSAENRDRLVERLRTIQPIGTTNTLAALDLAFTYSSVNTIILFTDGEPTKSSRKRKLFESHIEQIQQHVPEWVERGVPVNVVALGDYFERKFGRFLLDLATETGGAFLGR